MDQAKLFLASFDEGGGGNDPGDPIGQSLRFRGAQQLNGPTNTTDSTSYTLSFWFKIGDPEQGGTLFGRQYGSSVSGIEYTNGSLNFREKGEDSSANGLLRDPSAWYHLVYQKDDGNNSNGTAFINGIRQDATTGFIAPSSSYGWNFGARYNSSAYFDGYLADAYFIDGQVLDPTTFGRSNVNGVWVPVNYSGTYGTNGFHLDFSDPADIGADRSGNGNDFTATGFDMDPASLTYTYDYVTDSPTSNMARVTDLEPVTTSVYAKSGLAGLTQSTNASNANTWVQLALNTPITGKKYIEITAPNQGNPVYRCHGITRTPRNVGFPGQTADSWGYISYTAPGAGNLWNNNTSVPFATTYANDVVVGIAFDADTYELQYFLNGTKVGYTVTVDPGTYYFAIGGYNSASFFFSGSLPFRYAVPDGYKAMGVNALPAAPILNGRDHFQTLTGPGEGSVTLYEEDVNTGETGPLDPTSGGTPLPHSGSFTAAYIDFSFPETNVMLQYSGTWSVDHVVLSEDGVNWTDLGPQTLSGFISYTTADNGGNRVRYVRFHNSAAITMGFAGFSHPTSILVQAKRTFPNGLWWIKDRVNSNEHQLVDSVRGGAPDIAFLCPNQNEVTYAAPTGDSVAWCWNAGDSVVTNNDGDIETQVSANIDAGFSILTYTGNNTRAQTVGHGLSKAPEMVILKNRDRAVPFVVHHQGTGASSTIDTGAPLYPSVLLNTDTAETVDTEDNLWDMTATTFRVRPTTSSAGNWCNNLDRFVAYCWHSVPGYSAFGSYEGNNSTTDGPYTYLGFRPAWVMLKRTTGGTGDWVIYDSTRNPHNDNMVGLFPSTTDAEVGGYVVDLLSNGFKIRDNDVVNNNANSYIWAAFAENPFQAPVTAR